MRFEALEDGLAIMEGSQRGRKRDGAEGNDLRLLPGARFPIGDEHVVAESRAELGVFAERFRETGLGYAGDGDRCGHRASLGEKRRDGLKPAPTETDKIESRENSCYFAAFALMPLKASVRRDL